MPIVVVFWYTLLLSIIFELQGVVVVTGEVITLMKSITSAHRCVLINSTLVV